MLGIQSNRLLGLANKQVVVSVALIVNALIWYASVLRFVQANEPNICVLVIHFSGLIISAFFGASIAKRIERSHLLIFWMFLGTASSFFLFGLTVNSLLVSSLVSLFLGVSLGIGMPAAMSYFTDCTDVEKRGRISGIGLLLTGIGIFVFNIAIDVMIIDYLLWGGLLLAWRLSSLLLFLSVKSFRTIERKKSFGSYKDILRQQSFLLYFIPWITFSFINYLTGTTNDADIVVNTTLIFSFFMAIFAFVGGFFLDSFGRKRVTIIGFVMLGFSSAIRGLSSEAIILYFSAMIDGIAWGFILVIFIWVLWSDLSHNSASDKYYALGVSPYFASMFLNIVIGQYIRDNFVDTSVFSFTAFFLFLAVLPLVYAPETLPEKNLKERELKKYLDNAQKIKEKYF